MLLLLAALPISAQATDRPSIRIAVYHTGLGRDGPGLLLRDLRRALEGDGAGDVLAARDALVALSPDAVLLMDIDHDRDDLALSAFAALLAEAGLPFPHAFAPRPNTGIATGLDLDGDGRLGEGDDAQGWGQFAGSGGMALLSRLPIQAGSVRDFSTFLWRDLPNARIPRINGRYYPSEAVLAVQRLSSTGHWRLTLDTPLGPLALLAWHAGPPVFGGPHGRNRARNADETAFWAWQLATDPPAIPFVLLGDSNLDPEGGEGERRVMEDLLNHPQLQDPAPQAPLSSGGPPTRATAYWPDGPGALRVDYLLPSRTLRVLDSGLIWPSPEARHAIVWADLALPE